jgi:NADPH:quinone reductase-like Zn-dependent oxidoreductase
VFEQPLPEEVVRAGTDNAYKLASIGQRVFGLTDWYRDGTLAEYVAVEARNLTPLPGDLDSR